QRAYSRQARGYSGPRRSAAAPPPGQHPAPSLEAGRVVTTEIVTEGPGQRAGGVRSAGALIPSLAWVLVARLLPGDLAVQGRDHAAAVTAAVVLAITGIVYACAWRPRIVADSAGITVSNPVRDHRVPWALVEKVDVVNAVRVHCAPVSGADRGKVLYSW